MKILYPFFFFSGIILFIFSACCRLGEDDFPIRTVEFRIINQETNQAYFQTGGEFSGQSPEIYELDNTTLAEFDAPDINNGIIELTFSINPEIMESIAKREFLFHFPNDDIDTLEFFHIREEKRCDRIDEEFDRVIFNGTTFFDALRIEK